MDYSKYKKIAHEKLSQYGNPVKLIHVTGEPVYNPETHDYENQSEETNGVALQSSYEQKFVDGVNIKMSDKKFVVEIDKKPLPGDTLEYVGNQYSVIDVQEVDPDGKLAILYIVQGR